MSSWFNGKYLLGTNALIQGGPEVFCIHIVWADAIFNETVEEIPATNTTNASTFTVKKLPTDVDTYAFNTTVDDFSALKIGGLATKLNGHTTTNIWAVIQAQNSAVYTSMVNIFLIKVDLSTKL